MDYSTTFTLNDVCCIIEQLNEEAYDRPTRSQVNYSKIKGLLLLMGHEGSFDTIADIWEMIDVPYVVRDGLVFRLDENGNEIS